MGADRRFRALMMTALVDGLGLLPAAMSTRIGAQTQRPLAIVVIGGAISIALAHPGISADAGLSAAQATGFDRRR